jgi:hypothetical protein
LRDAQSTSATCISPLETTGDVNTMLKNREATLASALESISADTDGAATDADAGTDVETATRDGGTVPVDFTASGFTMAQHNASGNANAYSSDKVSRRELEALRAQSQSLSSIAQALIMQIQALNKQVDCLL